MTSVGATRTAAILASAIAVSVVLGSCISDRSSGPVTAMEACGVQLPPEAFGSTVVTIRNFAFNPTNVRIRPGTKVTWVNCDVPGSESHTSTSDATGWDSPLLPPGATYTREFAEVGSNPYHCTPHPGMKAAVTVE
jgi:plastocyanin